MRRSLKIATATAGATALLAGAALGAGGTPGAGNGPGDGTCARDGSGRPAAAQQRLGQRSRAGAPSRMRANRRAHRALRTLPPATSQALDAGERATLVFTRQEEKLARDVYRALARRYDDPVFARIAASEQRHMDVVGRLLARHGIDDPVAGMAAGEYADASLTARYAELMAQGRASLTRALQAGVDIEKADIADLGERIAQADNTDIDTVLTHLRDGSRNHLRAFTARLGS